MIKGFNREEKKALVAIIKFIINTDGYVSDVEIDKINSLAEEKGFEDFNEIFREVDQEVHSMEDIKALIKTVKKETHEFDILKYAFDIATADATIDPEEIKILKIMGKEWNVDIKTLLKG